MSFVFPRLRRECFQELKSYPQQRYIDIYSSLWQGIKRSNHPADVVHQERPWDFGAHPAGSSGIAQVQPHKIIGNEFSHLKFLEVVGSAWPLDSSNPSTDAPELILTHTAT